ncbi:MAG: formyltransferase family protein [Bryobacteraceae bacterium]|jgi:folate-dependent phosphoribosylglycinamide formyltransferase PurN
MKTYFLFHDKWTEYVKADWAASRFPFDGFVVIEKTRAGFVPFLRRRVRRLGIGKVADELFLRLYYVLLQSRRDGRLLRQFMAGVQRDMPADYRRPPVYRVHDINSDEAAALLTGLAPDVCILMVMPILKERILSIAPLGMLVFHPGVTPEYRGTHSPFWAVLNRDFSRIGWSLLRVDAGIDTGAVLAQGGALNPDPLTQSHIFLAHKSHVDGLPSVVETLRKLQAGEHPRVCTEGRQSHNYTHPGWTDYRKYRKVLKQLRREQAGPGVVPSA